MVKRTRTAKRSLLGGKRRRNKSRARRTRRRTRRSRR